MNPGPRLVKTAAFAAALALVSLIAASCAAKKPQGEKPGWVEETVKMKGDYLYGVGCAGPRIGNIPFRKSTAYERARVDLARAVRDYAVETLGDDPARTRKAVEDALPKRKTEDKWKAPDGTFCARVRVERSQVDARPDVHGN